MDGGKPKKKRKGLRLIKKVNMAGEKLENFVIRCLNCNKLNKASETLLHVDWKKKYYIINCFTCDATEAFNEEGKKIKIGKEEDGDGSGGETLIN